MDEDEVEGSERFRGIGNPCSLKLLGDHVELQCQRGSGMEQDEWSKIVQCGRGISRELLLWLLLLVQLPSSDNATQSTTAAGLVGLKSKPQSLKSHLEMTVNELKPSR